VTDQGGNKPNLVYDRTLLLHGPRRNEVLALAEIEQYGIDSFNDANYVSIYGMAPQDWYRRGVRLLGRTAVECTRDALGDLIGRDIAGTASRLRTAKKFLVIDPFAGSCNTLFWILKHLPNSQAIAFESDPQVFKLTERNVATLGQNIELVRGDYVQMFESRRFPMDWAIVVFVAPPWGTALDGIRGLDLRRTTPPITEVIKQFSRHFRDHSILFATQVYEIVNTDSLAEIQKLLDWTELRIYDINVIGRNHGILLGANRSIQ
jgi:hypothetical protein